MAGRPETTTRLITCSLAALVGVVVVTSASAAERIQYYGYSSAVEIRNPDTRVVLCPEVGGRILEYSVSGQNILYLSDAEKNWTPGDKPQSSAGRFDIGPELVIPQRPLLWSGKWTAEIIGEFEVKLESQIDRATGVQLTRTFQLDADSSHLTCTQSITNRSDSIKEWCHWSRTFAVGKGICVIPLTDSRTGPMSRFPNRFVMYEDGGIINMRPEDSQIRRIENALHIFPTPRLPKLGFDSYAGEIAYLAPNNLLFLKRFETYPDRVYNEAAGLTISVWYPDREMIELEPIGPRNRLLPGKSAAFTEHWYLSPYDFPGTDNDVDTVKLKQAVNDLR